MAGTAGALAGAGAAGVETAADDEAGAGVAGAAASALGAFG